MPSIPLIQQPSVTQHELSMTLNSPLQVTQLNSGTGAGGMAYLPTNSIVMTPSNNLKAAFFTPGAASPSMVHQVSVGSLNHHTSQLRQAARIYEEDSAILMQGTGGPNLNGSAMNRTPTE